MYKILLFISSFYFLTTQSHAHLSITEIHPNPKGKDQGAEWIEIHNPSNKAINTSGWQIQTQKGQKTINEELPHTNISPNNFFIIHPQATIKNSNNTIKLISPEKTITSTITYQKAPEGKSFSLIQTTTNKNTIKQSWQWITPSPQSLDITKPSPKTSLPFNLNTQTTPKTHKTPSFTIYLLISSLYLLKKL